ncbi:MAG TPA: FixH family protein [Albitalea sp.]|uniref:FixH family protein n=1 Tax=Piscinibacter sp. TaxID=1903157 RepID=UPI002ED25E04
MFRKAVLTVLAIHLSGCMTPPPDLDLSLTRTTAQKKYVVAIQPLAEPIAINQMHAWEVKVTSPVGEPVLQARIDVDGGMPQHGHGLPTRPRVTRELGDGRYLVEGMKFSMTGWWELKLNVQSGGVADQVTFNKVIALPAVSKS